MSAFLGRSRAWAARGLVPALVVLAGISLIGVIPANAALSPRLRLALHVAHLEHLAHLRALAAGRAAAVQRARPWELEIPAIGVAVKLTALGDPNGPELPVPPLSAAATEAGWYRFTSVPGSAGNAVIVGHVDTYVGPAVFYNLYQLRPGDAVDVVTGTGTERFAVRRVREVAKVQFPVDQVFGETGKHQLWLITCGGAFDYQTGHYMDNIIVSAVWQSPAKKHQSAVKRRTAEHSAAKHSAPKHRAAKHRAAKHGVAKHRAKRASTRHAGGRVKHRATHR